MLHHVINVKVLADYKLHLWFDDGQEGDIDITAHIGTFDGIFKPMKDLAFFRKVRILKGWGTITWPGDLDLDSEVLYSEVTGKPIILNGKIVYRPKLNRARRKSGESATTAARKECVSDR